MAPINREECLREISNETGMFPNCGVPATPFARPRAKVRRIAPGAALRALAIVGFGAIAIVASLSTNAAPPSPGCSTDWHQCKNDVDLFQNYQGIPDIQAACKAGVETAAKSEIRWPSPYFTYFRGSEATKTTAESGVVVLIEPNVQYPNELGAILYSTITCSYDLNQHKVVALTVSSNK
jgi:hypothetical protein